MIRIEDYLRRGCLTLALVAGWTVSLARADGPATAKSETTGPAFAEADDAPGNLRRGLEIERNRNWPAAIRHYESALERWPSYTDFGHRLNLCESHLKIVRRYQDRSFREILLRLSREKALELFDELVDRIETHYVQPVGLDDVVRRGLDNLEVALRDPNFLRVNGGSNEPARINWLRQALRQRRDGLEVSHRQAARTEIVAACDLARQALGIGPAPVILEFVYGACDVLDPYSNYLTPDKLDDMFSMIDGNFVGLGVELKQDDQGLRICGVIRGGPAAEAGLKAGDRITAVNGKPIKGMGLDEAANLLQGAENSSVDIEATRPDGSTRPIRLTRRHVDVASVTESKIVDKAVGIGYVQLSGFQKTSTDELDRAIRDLQRQGMRYLVLDLRGNPGGLLNVAVDIADRFVDQGVIVSTRGRASGQTQTYRARPDIVYTMPLAVLIDRESASASEILAGALKELKRAVVIGDHKSYGKGSVQSIYELRSVPAGLKLTTAQFYSPTGRPYSEQGVEPDTLVQVALKPAARDDQADPTPAFEVGNPDKDVVLSRAIQQARQRSVTSR